jgi:hypothetical protein
MKEIIPVTQIDNAPIGAGTVGTMTIRLHTIYSNFVKKTVQGL